MNEFLSTVKDRESAFSMAVLDININKEIFFTGLMLNDFERVRETVRIEDMIGEHVSLRRNGKEYVGLCPFHDDHSPSLRVSPQKGIYKCFSCGAGGDVISFTGNYFRISSGDALLYLANTYGVPISRHVDGRHEPAARDLLEAAANFFEKQLAGSPAENYLESRGIKEETKKEFRLGFAPASWDVPKEFVKDGSVETAVRAGLVSENEGRFYTRFRNRVIFPIIDEAKRVIGFAGRALDDSPAKYLNSPQSEIYDKSKTLYGLAQASKFIRDAQRMFIFEGYMDVVSAYQAGVRNAVATGGVALTDEHVQFLGRRYRDAEIVFAFDGDKAGQRAALNASEKVLGRLNASVCIFSPDEDDPSNIVEKGGDLESALQKIVPASEFFLDVSLQDKKLDSTERIIAYLESIAPVIRGIPLRSQGIFIEHIAQRVGVSPHSIENYFFDLENVKRGFERECVECEFMRSLCRAGSLEIVKYVREHVKVKDFRIPEARFLYEWFMKNSVDFENLFGNYNPLFQMDSLENLINKVCAEGKRDGITLNRRTLVRLMNGVAASRLSLSEIEEIAASLRAFCLSEKVAAASRIGINFVKFVSEMQKLEELLQDEKN